MPPKGLPGKHGAFLETTRRLPQRPKKKSTKDHEGPPSVTALPHRQGCGPASRRVPPREAGVMGAGPPGSAGVPPACTAVACCSECLRVSIGGSSSTPSAIPSSSSNPLRTRSGGHREDVGRFLGAVEGCPTVPGGGGCEARSNWQGRVNPSRDVGVQRATKQRRTGQDRMGEKSGILLAPGACQSRR